MIRERRFCLAVCWAVGSLNSMVDAKASGIKRLRTESDEARINLPTFIWRAIRFAGVFQEKLEGECKVETRHALTNGAEIGSEGLPHS